MTHDDARDDRELLAVLGDDPVAFEAFYRRHVDRITGFAVRRCDGPEEVADLVATVFLAVIESAHRYDPVKGEPISWLFAVAVNQLRASWRRTSRQRAVARRVSGQRLLEPTDHLRFEEMIDAERQAEHVRRAVARLPRGERALFELVARDGLTAAQAGEVLGISVTAARVRLSRARAKLRGVLESPTDDDAGGRGARSSDLGSPPAVTGRAPPGRTEASTARRRTTAEEVAP